METTPACLRSELNLFSQPPVQLSIDGGRWGEVVPLTSLDAGSRTVIEFVKGASAEHYYDLSKTLLYLKCKITKGDGSSLGNGAKVAPVNNTLGSVFSQADVWFNSELVSSSSSHYAYKSYLEAHLGSSKDVKNGRLSAAMYTEDSNLDEIDPESDSNPGLKYRYEKCGRNNTFELMGKPSCDIFNITRYLIPGVEIRVRFSASNNNFCLIAPEGDNYKLNFVDAKLIFHRISISPSLSLAIERTLERQPAIYPMVRTETRAFHVGDDRADAMIDNLYAGELPKRVTIGLVRNEAYNGDLKKNPYHFEHFGLTRAELFCDGERVPWNELVLDCANASFLQAYYTLFTGADALDTESTSGISRDEYLDGSCLLVYDLTPDQSAASVSHVCPKRRANLRVKLNFSQKLPKTVNLLALFEFDNIMAIDKARKVTYDYTPPSPSNLRRHG